MKIILIDLLFYLHIKLDWRTPAKLFNLPTNFMKTQGLISDFAIVQSFSIQIFQPPPPSGGSPASHHSNGGVNGMTILQVRS